ncbi:unnamed protein product [Chrysodeixis includens]|uniref:Uncharacterized protein n=1 Tax=Chrysodeixis includens TaxID=689277 RepID=A0A9N8L1I2_CHRIL|nr:unnamed protein product [Chrysodeixis includens]
MNVTLSKAAAPSPAAPNDCAHCNVRRSGTGLVPRALLCRLAQSSSRALHAGRDPSPPITTRSELTPLLEVEPKTQKRFWTEPSKDFFSNSWHKTWSEQLWHSETVVNMLSGGARITRL